ncbi:hypothetical protein KQX54_011472 [Cotesia glomerata]|uniref:Uncharacterized protein n=1 Tax=Cotesia glomerata TaxID=32391 RepID=A0AAV7IQN7_COTGL|nr:hypothetical protein KQX54_011472 [Cotesia glomerata]
MCPVLFYHLNVSICLCSFVLKKKNKMSYIIVFLAAIACAAAVTTNGAPSTFDGSSDWIENQDDNRNGAFDPNSKWNEERNLNRDFHGHGSASTGNWIEKQDDNRDFNGHGSRSTSNWNEN